MFRDKLTDVLDVEVTINDLILDLKIKDTRVFKQNRQTRRKVTVDGRVNVVDVKVPG